MKISEHNTINLNTNAMDEGGAISTGTTQPQPKDRQAFSNESELKRNKDGNGRCPVCQLQLRLFFINFDDKILMCEDIECSYPFNSDSEIRIEKPDEKCPLCQCYLRQFYVNLNDKVLICESMVCMYPFKYELPTEVERNDATETPKLCTLCQSELRLFFISFNEKLMMCTNIKCEFPFVGGKLDVLKIKPEIVLKLDVLKSELDLSTSHVSLYSNDFQDNFTIKTSITGRSSNLSFRSTISRISSKFSVAAMSVKSCVRSTKTTIKKVNEILRDSEDDV